MKKKEIEKEFEELSPFLSNLKRDKKEGFSMPTNYFDRFEDRLMHRIEEEEALDEITNLKSEASTLSGFNFWSFFKTLIQPRYAVGFSTVVLLIAFGLYFVNNGIDLPNEKINIEGLLAEADIDDYINNNIEEFTTDEILAVLALDEIETIQKKIVPIEELTTEPSTPETTAETETSSMDKALEKVAVDDLLDDLTIDDLEIEEADLF